MIFSGLAYSSRMDVRAIREALIALSPMQRKAFTLLVLEHVATALEVPDRGRYDAYKRAPRFNAILARRWRALAGIAAPAVTTPATSGSVAHLLPDGSMGQRFAELLDFQALPEDGTVDDDEMLLELQVSETDQTAAWVFDAATLALSVLDADNPLPLFVNESLGSVEQLYEMLDARDALAAHVDVCLAFARAFTGSLEGAAVACAQARARGAAVLAARATD